MLLRKRIILEVFLETVDIGISLKISVSPIFRVIRILDGNGSYFSIYILLDTLYLVRIEEICNI